MAWFLVLSAYLKQRTQQQAPDLLIYGIHREAYGAKEL